MEMVQEAGAEVQGAIGEWVQVLCNCKEHHKQNCTAGREDGGPLKEGQGRSQNQAYEALQSQLSQLLHTVCAMPTRYCVCGVGVGGGAGTG